jgi:hypothetical protein
MALFLNDCFGFFFFLKKDVTICVLGSLLMVLF